MPEKDLPLEELINRLDVLCSVIEPELKPGGRATKHDLRLLHEFSQQVIQAYFKQHYEKDYKNAKPAS